MGCCCSKSQESIVYPEPQGPYSVGCADIMTNAADDDKGLFIRVFYPTDKVDIALEISKKSTTAKYMYGFAKAASPCCFCFFKCLIDCHTPDKPYLSAGIWHAPIAKDGGPFRLVVLSTGFSAYRSSYSVFSANLASYGFIVATTEPREDACYTFTLTKEGTKEEFWVHKTGIKFSLTKVTNYDRYYANKDKVAPWRKLVDTRIKESLQTLELFTDMSKGTGCFGENSQKCIVVGQEFDWTQFLGRITIDDAAMVGHSLGGSASVAAMACPQFSYFVHFDAQMFFIDERYYEEMEKIRPAKALFFVQVQ